MTIHSIAGGGGLMLNVEATGNPSGKPIVFLHGFSHCHMAWIKQLRSDLANDFYLVAMDLRGHGASEKPQQVYGDSKLWADDVHAVIATLGLDRPVLVGWSYGGAVMSDYVKFYGEAEIAGTNWVGAVSRLGGPLAEGGFVGGGVMEPMADTFSDSVAACVPALQEIIRQGTQGELSPEEQYFFLGYHVIVPPYVRSGLLARDVNHDDVVARMNKPMLLSQGELDRVILPSMARHIAGLAGHAQLALYAETGHMLFWEASERFNRELRTFREAI